MNGHTLIQALIAALVICVFAYIADFFLAKGGVGFPRQLIWLIALVVWLVYVFGGFSL